MLRIALAFAIAVVAIVASGGVQADSVSKARQNKFETGCIKGCLRDSGDFDYCSGYCACVKREVFSGRSAAQVDVLYTAMRPRAPESPQKKLLTELMDRCVVEADSP